MSHFSHVTNKEVKALAESQNKFTKDLYVALTNGSHGNLFFSPFSIANALFMVHMGSKGNTALQMQSVMHLPDENSSLRKLLQELVLDLKSEIANFALRISNVAYISHELSVSEKFSSLVSDDILSNFKHVDFSQSVSAQKAINETLDKDTSSKIKNTSDLVAFNDSTRMALVNGIYFKGLWAHPFNPAKTKTRPFWVSADTSVDVPMMCVEKHFKAVEKPELDATVLDLDYKGNQLSLVIILPNKKDGLPLLEQKLPSLDLGSLDSMMKTQETLVYLPKFKLEQAIELKPVLSELGMCNLFSDELADLSGISEEKPLFVSNVVHKALLEVDEEGFEEDMDADSKVLLMLSIPQTFKVDHPFFFYIRDRSSHAVLFAVAFNDSTRMALVNGIYFKGLWAHPFNPAKTKTRPFWVSADTSVDVPMMCVEKHFKAVEKPELDATVLDLDYKGNQLSLVIILPNKKDGLPLLEQKLPSLDLGSLDSMMKTQETLVYLPKFKLEQAIELKPVLSELGMCNLFSDELADLSGISEEKPLFVSNVVHKALLEVDEEGFEEDMDADSKVLLMLSIPQTFKVDHPFFFYIRDRSSHAVLFAGRFVSP